MTTEPNHPNVDDTGNTGLRCAECGELIPAETGHQIHSREVDDVVVHFCGPEYYHQWLERGGENRLPD